MVYIASTKDKAIDRESKDTSDVKIFTDGSAINGGVGAAAVIYKEGRRIKTAWKYLGSDQKHTVYEAECVAILMGLHIVKRWKYKKATVYADNQAALQGLTANETGSGKYMLDAIHDEIKEATKKNGRDKIRLRWIPGHQGVEGNEAVDVEAKKAAGGKSSPKKDLPKMLKKNLPVSKSAVKQKFKGELKKASLEKWEKYAEGKFIAKTAPDLPSKKHCEKLGELSRKGACIWTQLKTGHIGLNKHLHRIKVVQSPKCPSCKTYDESVEHYLLHCDAYRQERIEMKRKIRGRTKDLGRLLGNHRNAEAVIDYVTKTGRLKWAKEKGEGRIAEREAEETQEEG